MSLKFILYSRPGCHLCDEMLADLTAISAGHHIEVSVVDVDGDPELRRRFGLRIPVLTMAGEEVCTVRLVPDRIRSLLEADG